MRISRFVWLALFSAAVVAGTMLPANASTLPAGTAITVRLNNDVVPGDKGKQQFSADLANSVFVNGREVLPMGSRIEGEVRGTKKSVVLSPRYLYLPNGKRLDFNAAVDQINGRRLKASEKEGNIQKQGEGADAARQAAEIGVTGAGVGGMATRSAKGMGVGAAAGVAAVLIGRKIAGHHGSTVIPAGTELTLDMSRPLDIPDSATDTTDSPRTNPDDRRPILQRRGD